MNLKAKLFLLVMLLVNIQLFAQDSYGISGTVVDERGVPIPGVNVVVLNTTNGTQTDFDGNYTLTVSNDDVLQFSYIGFMTKTIIIAGQTKLDTFLTEDINQLDEVVVIGYGEQKQKNVTSALTKISGEELENISVARVEDALQGKVAGLRIQTTASEAGGDPKITLRGPGSITGESSPLIVVDGVVLGTDADILGTIDNNNIASISVLKDASSVAIYGSRGANGVILVNLKEGVVGKTSFSYNTFTGYRYAQKNDNFNSTVAEERARLLDLESTVNGIVADSPNFERINNNYNTALVELEAFDFITSLGTQGEVNLQDEIFPGGTIISHSFAARGGTELTNYSASIGYLEDEGIAIGDKFTKYNINVKINSKSKNKKIKFGVNLRANYNDQDRLPSRFTDGLRQYGTIPLYIEEEHLPWLSAGSTSNAGLQFEGLGLGSYGFSRVFDQVFVADPNNPQTLLRDENGLPIRTGDARTSSTGLTLGLTGNVHPLVFFLERESLKKQFTLNTSSYIDFELAKGLNFTQTVSGVFRNTRNNVTTFLFGQENRQNETSREEARDELTQYAFESLLKYNRTFGKHSINPVAGFEFTVRDFRRQESAAAFFTNDFNTNIALGDNGITFTQQGQDKLVSYFGRINYDYDNKYLLQVSARADGSTRFGPDSRFGFFPAASVGWNVSNENFLASSDVITFLKLRASYGVSGSNQISNNIYESLYRFENTFETVSYNDDIGVKATALQNSDLGWERLVEFNPGIDITFGRNLFSLSADYYTRSNESLILFAPIASVYGTDSWLQNIGKVKNEGVELALSSRVLSTENFRWNMSGQFTLNRNTVEDLGGNDQIISRISQDTRPTEFIATVGQPITSFYGWVYDREIPLEWVDNPFNRFNNDYADVYVKDLNNDGIIDDEDRTELGSPYPDFTWGLNSDIAYKNFDFSWQLQGSHGGEVRVADLDQLLFASESAVQEVGSFPDADLTVHRRFTSDHIQDASFVSLRNLSVGYTLPDSFTSKYNISKMRLYMTGENLIYVTAAEYEGFNPEAQGQTSENANTPLTSGYQRGDGPIVRTISAGINFNF